MASQKTTPGNAPNMAMTGGGMPALNSQQSESASPTTSLYKDFLSERATSYKDIKIESMQSYRKYYKLMRVNQASNRKQ